MMFEHFDYNFARVMTYFLSYPAVIGFILFEQCVLKQNHWQKALVVMCLIISLNTLLKHFFAVPLMPPMLGFAVPSGHMHTAAAFWGYLAYCYRSSSILQLLLLCLLFFGWSLVKLHYHSYFDVSVAALLAIIEIAIIVRLQAKRPELFLEIATALLLVGCLWYMPKEMPFTLAGITAYYLAITKSPYVKIWLLGLWLLLIPNLTLSYQDLIFFTLMYSGMKISGLVGTKSEFSFNYRPQ